MNKLPPKLDGVYFGKTWYLYVAASLFTALAIFSLTLGPLFLTGVMKKADGSSAREAGVALSIMAIPLCLVALLGWFNVYARRKPLLRICEEGIEINIIGASTLDGVPLVPKLVRVAWLIGSGQGFRQQIGWIPWEMLRAVSVEGAPLVRSLVIDATIVYPQMREDGFTAKVADKVAFRDAEFRAPLDSIAAAIIAFASQPNAREGLPSLYD